MTESSLRSSNFIRVALLVLALSTPVIILIWFGTGFTMGEEFSPDDFSRRSFLYNRLPILNWTVIGKTYDDTTPALEQTLVLDGLITERKIQPKTWHLFRDSGTEFNQYKSHDCDARFLVGYLDLNGSDGTSFWTSWNESCPQSAKIFWPIVAEMARDELYLGLPPLMRFAMETKVDQPVLFGSQIANLAAKSYLDLGSLDFEQANLERAEHRLARSIEWSPSKTALLLLADVYQAQNKPEQAQQRRTAAETAADPFAG